jgi:hypothetical protein
MEAINGLEERPVLHFRASISSNTAQKVFPCGCLPVIALTGAASPIHPLQLHPTIPQAKFIMFSSVLEFRSMSHSMYNFVHVHIIKSLPHVH